MRSSHAAGLAALLLAAGCGGQDETQSVRTNQVQIARISPTRAVAGRATEFTIDVAYSLVASKPSGVINYCFAPQGWGWCILEDDERVVSSGLGRVSFTATKTLDGPNEVTVYLSDSPHPDSWDPLDSDYAVVPTSP